MLNVAAARHVRIDRPYLRIQEIRRSEDKVHPRLNLKRSLEVGIADLFKLAVRVLMYSRGCV